MLPSMFSFTSRLDQVKRADGSARPHQFHNLESSNVLQVLSMVQSLGASATRLDIFLEHIQRHSISINQLQRLDLRYPAQNKIVKSTSSPPATREAVVRGASAYFINQNDCHHRPPSTNTLHSLEPFASPPSSTGDPLSCPSAPSGATPGSDPNTSPIKQSITMSHTKWTLEMRQAAKLLCYELNIRRPERKAIFDTLFGCTVSIESISSMGGESRKPPGAPRRSPDWDRINANPQSAQDQQMRARLVADIQRIQRGQWTAGEVTGSAFPDAAKGDGIDGGEEHSSEESTSVKESDALKEKELASEEEVDSKSDAASPAQESSHSTVDKASRTTTTESTKADTEAEGARPTLESGLPSVDLAKWLLEKENGPGSASLKFLHSVEIIQFQNSLLYRRNRNLTQADRAHRSMPKTVGGVTFSADLTETRQICVQSKCPVCQGEDGNSNGSLSPLTNEERHWLSTKHDLPSDFFALASSGRLSFLTEDEQREMKEAMAAEETEAMAGLTL
jgi:hypothetical protein